MKFDLKYANNATYFKDRKYKVPELDEIMKLCFEAGAVDIVSENEKNATARIGYIQDALAKFNGYPHRLQEGDFALSPGGWPDGRVAGEVIIVPFDGPHPNETPEEKKSQIIGEIVAYLVNTELAENEVNAVSRLQATDLIKNDCTVAELEEVAQRVLAGEYDDFIASKEDTTDNTQENAPAVENAPFSDGINLSDVLAQAIAEGKITYEHSQVVKSELRVRGGALRYDLYTLDGCTYSVSSEEALALIN